jgi:hypothetical protein
MFLRASRLLDRAMEERIRVLALVAGIRGFTDRRQKRAGDITGCVLDIPQCPARPLNDVAREMSAPLVPSVSTKGRGRTARVS